MFPGAADRSIVEGRVHGLHASKWHSCPSRTDTQGECLSAIGNSQTPGDQRTDFQNMRRAWNADWQRRIRANIAPEVRQCKGILLGQIIWLVWLVRLAKLQINADVINDDGIVLVGVSHDLLWQ